MSDAPELLLAHHLKALRLPTFLREYDKQARICAAEGRGSCALSGPTNRIGTDRPRTADG